MNSKPRVAYVLHYYPQLSQTYIKNEIEALLDDYDLSIIALKQPDLAYKNHQPFQSLADMRQVREAIEEFRPDVLHSHYLANADQIGQLAEQTGVPFTIRAHSFDTLKGRIEQRVPTHLKAALASINSDYCLGVLCFPFTRGWLEQAGIRSDKLHDCWPVIAYDKFHNRAENGSAIMNVGACLPKKRMEDFVLLAQQDRSREFNLYCIGYHSDELVRFNQEHGSPVQMHEPLEPDEMPAVYKRHGWLVYTACPKLCTVGWPLAVAEAQAAGLGVCLPNIRPDITQYLGGAGFAYNSVAEAAEIISRPYPEEMRELGFEHAKRSDIQRHKHILTDLWRQAAPRPRIDSSHSIARRPSWLPRWLSQLGIGR